MEEIKMTAEYITVIIGGLFILIGAVTLIMEIIGIYRFNYSLTRMHAAALGDTGGLMLTITGLIILNGLQASSVKLAAIVVLMWIASPVSSHMLSKLIYRTDSEVYEKCNCSAERKDD